MESLFKATVRNAPWIQLLMSTVTSPRSRTVVSSFVAIRGSVQIWRKFGLGIFKRSSSESSFRQIRTWKEHSRNCSVWILASTCSPCTKAPTAAHSAYKELMGMLVSELFRAELVCRRYGRRRGRKISELVILWQSTVCSVAKVPSLLLSCLS